MRLRIPGLQMPADPEVTVILPEPLASEVRVLLTAGKKVEAVRVTRRMTSMNLVPAVRAVEAVQDQDVG